jgi:hypothetical protein
VHHLKEQNRAQCSMTSCSGVALLGVTNPELLLGLYQDVHVAIYIMVYHMDSTTIRLMSRDALVRAGFQRGERGNEE